MIQEKRLILPFAVFMFDSNMSGGDEREREEDKDRDKMDLDWRDYVAFIIALLQTTLLPIILIVVILVLLILLLFVGRTFL